MESILDQLYWLWVPVSFLPEWLRLFVVLFVVFQILFKIVPVLVHWLCRLLRKLLYWVSYPIMLLISLVLGNLREAGNGGIPRWVDVVEGFFGLCERVLGKVMIVFSKKKRYRRKWSFYAGTALAVLVAAAVVHNPGEWYSLDWKKTEDWLAWKMPGRGDVRTEAVVPVQASSKGKELVLNKQYRDGGNIREAPSLAARSLYTIAFGEMVQFMNEERVDSKGIKWLKVKTDNGRVEGWVSARIVREK